ncbi:MAG: S8 family serine peptidase [Akkermansiaceae bacterium]
MTKSLIITALFAASFSLATGQLIEGKYEVALNEVEHQPSDGGVAKPMSFQKQKSVAALINFVDYLSQATGEHSDLVLYQKGVKRDAHSRRVLTRKILVKKEEGARGEAIAQAVGAMNFSEPSYAEDYLILEFEAMGDSLKKLPTVRAVAGVLSADLLMGRKRFKRFTPNDPRYAHSATNPRYQWHLKNTGANGGTAREDANVELAWDQVKGAGITIGIVDDGLEVEHPDLAANVNTAIDRDWNDNTPDDPTPTSSFDDHGTSCAGVTAGKGNNGVGISGVAPDATLVGLRLIAGNPSDAEEAEAMHWRNDLIQVKNNSWGPSDGGGILESAGPLVDAAFASSVVNGRGGLGTIHLWAAGNGYANDNVNQDGYANQIYTIAIGAVTDTGERSDYSEPGCAKVISAPSNGGGQSITTTTLVQNGSYTDSFGGTSSATPLASGVVALMLEKNPNLGWRDVQEVLIRSARKNIPHDSGWINNGANFNFHHDFGAGVVDAHAAVNLSATWNNLPAQDSFSRTRSNLNQAIPDNSPSGTTVEFDLSTETSLRIEHVTLALNVTHPTRGHLRVSLTSPSGTESLLSVPHNNSGPNYDDWKMMTVFNWGEASPGVWILKVADEENGQTGTLNAATIEVFGSVSAPPTEPPAFVHDENTTGHVGSAFSYSVRATNSATEYAAQGLPPGLSISAANGLISGTPTIEGTYGVTLSATNIVGTTNGSLTMNIGPRIPTPPVITSRDNATALLNQPFEYLIEASNNPISYSVSPPLPAGLSLSPTGLIFGTATISGDYQFQLSAANADGVGNLTWNLQVIEAGTGPLAEALDNNTLFFSTEDEPGWALQSTTFISDNDALQSPPLSNNESASFSAEVNGPGFMTFQWKVSSEEGFDQVIVSLDGAQKGVISGEVDWTEGFVLVPEGIHTVTWSYAKDSSESDGQDRAWVDLVVFEKGDFISSLGEALDYPGLTWIPDGEWLGQPIITNDGIDALQTPSIEDNEETTLEVDITGPGTFEFYYRCSSEEDYDFFTFTLDGVEEFSVSGQVAWRKHTVTIPAGNHTLRWKYQKDFSSSVGDDAAWIDQVVWTSDSISGYQQWLNLHFSPSEQADPQVGAEISDPDDDGRANLTEYAFGTSPWITGLENEPTVAAPGEYVALTYLADLSKSDIFYQIQESVDLENWTTIPQSLVSTNGDSQTRRAMRQRAGEHLYLRVKILQAP